MTSEQIIEKCKALTQGPMPLPGNPVEKERIDGLKSMYKMLFGSDLCEGCGGKFENGYTKLKQIGQGILDIDGKTKKAVLPASIDTRITQKPKNMNVKTLAKELLAFAKQQKASQVLHLNAGNGELTKLLADELPFLSFERNRTLFEESSVLLKDSEGRAFWGEPFGVLNRTLLGAHKQAGIEVKSNAFYVFDTSDDETDNLIHEVDMLYRFKEVIGKPSLAFINLKGEGKAQVDKYLKHIYGNESYETSEKEVGGVKVFFACAVSEAGVSETPVVSEEKPKSKRGASKAKA